RMLMVSQKVHAMRRGRKRDQALDLLWASQGNDPYWHGVFGGIYLFNFRAANYQYLLAAENAADAEATPMTLLRTDFDRDSREGARPRQSPDRGLAWPGLVPRSFRCAVHDLRRSSPRAVRRAGRFRHPAIPA